jgi:hypothetical protein
MSPALVISRREIRTYFNSPVAYIVVTVFTIITGYLFFGFQLFSPGKQACAGSSKTCRCCSCPGAGDHVACWRMRGPGTLELLITMPVRDWGWWSGVPGGDGAAAAALGLTRRSPSRAPSVPGSGPPSALRRPAADGRTRVDRCDELGVHPELDRRVHRRLVISFALFILGVISYMPQSLQPLMSFLSIGKHFDSISAASSTRGTSFTTSR